jgi:hypothetical protein
MASENEKKLKLHRARRKRIRVKPDFIIKIIERPRDDGISPGRAVIAADVILKRMKKGA